LNQNCLGIIEVGSPISIQSQSQSDDMIVLWLAHYHYTNDFD
jgi:hypothetical protein